MPSTDHLIAFLAATAIFAAIPGPGILYTAAQTLARGRVGGLMAALGLHLGGYVHVAAPRSASRRCFSSSLPSTRRSSWPAPSI